MTDGITFPRLPVDPVKPDSPIRGKPSSLPDAIKGKDFRETLHREIDKGKIKFSGHATMRMRTQNVYLSDNEIMRLGDAVNRAEAKGARESLILMDKLALVVSIKNRTVITAVNEERMKENVFTNIDSAVII
ncbi:MAG: flagellar protein [Firmicutes bacterium]|nr:flagellar protein [Bacillota bacterium]